MTNDRITPFLKWPGGKRWLVDRIVDKIRLCQDGQYIEPFVGSGAVFFALRPSRAILSDVNSELIGLYVVMRDHPEELQRYMIRHQKHHSKEYYYEIRSKHPRTAVSRAARMLYLNRTCFNGMYRVNRFGNFNVPIGSKSDCVYDIDLFPEYSKALKNTEILVSDFEKVISRAEKNDFVFADPPYAVSGKNVFTKYNDKLFTWGDQVRLFNSLKQARDNGVHVLSTNAFCEGLVEMYESEGFFLSRIQRPCSIAGDPNKRKMVDELIISTERFGE